MSKPLPTTTRQVETAMTLMIACPTCHVGPNEPCVFVNSRRRPVGAPRDAYVKSHEYRIRPAREALAVWREQCWPNTERRQEAS